MRSSADAGSIGFLADARRINVALTRAKYSLIIVGDEKTLVKDDIWKDLIEGARQQNQLKSLQLSDYYCKNRKIDNLFIAGAEKSHVRNLEQD